MNPLSLLQNEILPVWIQTITNIIVLLFLYRQIRQINVQMSQNEEQSRVNRSWELIRFYQEVHHDHDSDLRELREQWWTEPKTLSRENIKDLHDSLFLPALPIFRLMNQLIRLQQVDERLLFGYLEREFRSFIDLGTEWYGKDVFNTRFRPDIQFLAATWYPEYA